MLSSALRQTITYPFCNPRILFRWLRIKTLTIGIFSAIGILGVSSNVSAGIQKNGFSHAKRMHTDTNRRNPMPPLLSASLKQARKLVHRGHFTRGVFLGDNVIFKPTGSWREVASSEIARALGIRTPQLKMVNYDTSNLDSAQTIEGGRQFLQALAERDPKDKHSPYMIGELVRGKSKKTDYRRNRPRYWSAHRPKH